MPPSVRLSLHSVTIVAPRMVAAASLTSASVTGRVASRDGLGWLGISRFVRLRGRHIARYPAMVKCRVRKGIGFAGYCGTGEQRRQLTPHGGASGELVTPTARQLI